MPCCPVETSNIVKQLYSKKYNLLNRGKVKKRKLHDVIRVTVEKNLR